jgi:hypothetical protein
MVDLSCSTIAIRNHQVVKDRIIVGWQLPKKTSRPRLSNIADVFRGEPLAEQGNYYK